MATCLLPTIRAEVLNVIDKMGTRNVTDNELQELKTRLS